jgi:target of rapamycin complex subunit LST8
VCATHFSLHVGWACRTVPLSQVTTNNPQPVLSFDGHTNNVTAVGFERDSKWLFSGSEDGTVKLWDVR